MTAKSARKSPSRLTSCAYHTRRITVRPQHLAEGHRGRTACRGRGHVGRDNDTSAADARIRRHARFRAGPRRLCVCRRGAVIPPRSRRSQPLRTTSCLRNGRIVDGTGSPWFTGDVAITRRRDREDRAGDRRAGGARDRRRAARSSRPASSTSTRTRGAASLDVPTAPNYVRQGVTTVMEGPDGSSPLPIAPFLAQLERAGQVAQHRHASSARARSASAVIGRRQPRRRRRRRSQKMAGLVEQGMKDGAFGLSTGLFYVPGHLHADRRGRSSSRRRPARFGGMHESHQRDDAAKVLDSVQRDDRDRRAGAPADADQPREGRRRRRTGAERRHAAAGRRGAGARRGRDDRSVSLHRVEHEHRGGADAGVGARRRARGDAGAAARIPAAREKAKAGHRRDDPRRARRRRSEERAVRELRVRSVARRQDARRSHAARAAWSRPSRTPPKS